MVNENMEFEAIVRQWLDNVRLRVKESSYVSIIIWCATTFCLSLAV